MKLLYNAHIHTQNPSQPEVYYISNLPSELQWRDVTTITGVAFVLALVATLYPSWRAARVNPAGAVRDG